MESNFEKKSVCLNKETVAALKEAKNIAHDPEVVHYSDVEKALQELKR